MFLPFFTKNAHFIYKVYRKSLVSGKKENIFIVFLLLRIETELKGVSSGKWAKPVP